MIKFEREEDYGGSSLQGSIDISYANLVAVFGPPHSDSDGYKVDAFWSFVVKDMPHGDGCTGVVIDEPIVFTLYNYKDGKNYNGDEGTPVEDITDWHIGGHNKRAVAAVVTILQEFQRPRLEEK